ncbi:hypothetical protein ACFYO7_20245 [Nocardia salmonicida]|uniref:hypothetical protein n=1 Tax=Nocardia salmonicida TaxID=53431 RepID=UPI0036A27A16
MTLTLVGYTDRGLDADLARRLSDESEPVVVSAETRSVEPFLEKLGPVDAAALAAFDRRVRSGRLPQFLDIFDWSYAFDFAGNGCKILDADYTTELTDEDGCARARSPSPMSRPTSPRSARTARWPRTWGC